MKELITYFPEEICLKIIQYTYMPQDKYLLNDIVNYTESKTKLLDLYYKYWIVHNEVDEYKNWLSNDLMSYANNFQPTMNGYVDNFYNIFLRNPFLKFKEKIHKYVCNLNKNNITREINIYLGLLVIQERKDFIQWFIINHY